MAIHLGMRAIVFFNLLIGALCFVNPVSRCSCAFMPRRASYLQSASILRPQVAQLCSPHMKVELGPEETVEKYGLEAGIFQTLRGKEGEDGKGKMASAQELLKRYGSAYLITSITFAAISFGICYLGVSNGVDIAGLLNKIGIKANASTETTSTLAVAYAIHKAASPIRFPPTVALTPVVARFLGKEIDELEE